MRLEGSGREACACSDINSIKNVFLRYFHLVFSLDRPRRRLRLAERLPLGDEREGAALLKGERMIMCKRIMSKVIQVPIPLRAWAEWREEVMRERPAAQHVTECGLVCREQKLHVDAAAAPIWQQQLPVPEQPAQGRPHVLCAGNDSRPMLSISK
jgi:hypothetical protein